MKKIVFYFGFPIEEWVPFSTFPYKMGTYSLLIEFLIAQDCECFLAGGRESYLGNGYFSACRRYQPATRSWEPCSEPVQADVIFDRTKWLDTFDSSFEERRINTLNFKRFGNDKFRMLGLFQEFTKPFFLVQSEKELSLALQRISSQNLIVAKPVNGIKGRGIFIGTPKEIAAALPSITEPYLIQEFIDTSKGIPNITDTSHDIRFVVANGKIILAALRTPKSGSLLANVAQGGSIKEVDLATLPPVIIEQAEKLQQKIDALFGPAYYSLDFGIEAGVPFLFEINDRIGFPRETMPHARSFAEELAKTILSRAQ